MIEGVRRAGDRALIVELGGLDEVMAFHARVTAEPLGQIDQVAAARTVLLTFAGARDAERAAARVREVSLDAVPEGGRRTVELEVVYDGEDLDDVARLAGLSREAVVAAHAGTPWLAAFGGFAPGFCYLTGGDPRLTVPRRSAPRTAVPAGSVALAGEFSAVYPRASPGGWRLIGRTGAALWDLDREPPALLAPGDRVRFRPVREIVRGAEPQARRGPATVAGGFAVAAPGILSLIEDEGRPGRADLGVTASGAADARAAREANRLVGNDRAAAVIECAGGGLAVTAEADHVVALAGADAAAAIDDRPVPHGAPFVVRRGETLRLGFPTRGLRTCLAVRGGVDAPVVLGSRSADTLSGIGPAPLRAGDRVAVGPSPRGAVALPAAPADPAPDAPLRIVWGPRDDWFDAAGRDRLISQAWRVSPQSDRVGARLEPADGAPLRPRDGDLPSEGMVAGAIQVPPSGEPVLFGADHPVTGGYPVIAVVVHADLPRAAQLRPGDVVRFAEA